MYSNFALKQQIDFILSKLNQLTPPVGGFVPVNGDITINDIKTFSTLPRSAVIPITNDELVNKLYVDTVPIPSNVALKNATNIFTTTNTFQDTITLDNGNPSLYSTLNPTELRVVNDTGGGGYSYITGNNVSVFNTVSGANCQMTEIGLINTGTQNLTVSSSNDLILQSVNDTTLQSSNQINLNSFDNVNINCGVNLIATCSDNIIMTANNDSISFTADDNLTLFSSGLGNINLDSPNINCYTNALPICFNFIEIDRNYNYTSGGQNWEQIWQQSLNVPSQFFVDNPQSGYTSSKWKIDFSLNTWSTSNTNNQDKALAFYFDFNDQNNNTYSTPIFDKNKPFCYRNNDSTWTQGNPLQQFIPFSWNDIVDFQPLSGTGSGNTPLKFNLYISADNPRQFDFSYTLALTRVNLL